MIILAVVSQPVMRQNMEREEHGERRTWREKNMVGQSCSSHGHTEAERRKGLGTLCIFPGPAPYDPHAATRLYHLFFHHLPVI